MSDTTPARVRRVFSYNGAVLADPDPTMSPEVVKKHYSNAGYPELTNASTVGPEHTNGKTVYTFKKSVGTKG